MWLILRKSKETKFCLCCVILGSMRASTSRDFIQECIPVGCVSPARWPYPVVSRGSAQPLWMQTLRSRSTQMQTPHGCRPPRCRPPYVDPPMQTLPMQTPPMQTPWIQTPPVDRQTPVKTLPCPKFPLRAVISAMTNVSAHSNGHCLKIYHVHFKLALTFSGQGHWENFTPLGLLNSV